ncbi:MAG: hypothetical protein JXR94_07780 [Candidatus Hydrogenedentes bacterium]|nr:hypothetical protein [Candidatus Hydrogenedentota bacterium]
MRQMLTTAIAILCAAALPTAESRPAEPGAIAEALSEDLPAGWRCITDLDCIVIFREEKVTLLNPSGLPGLPGWRGIDGDEILREYGLESQYMMVLVFRPRLSDEQYAKLVESRDTALRKIGEDGDLDTKETAYNLTTEKERHPIPEYFNERYSIYVHRTDRPCFLVYPEAAAQERDRILATLSQFMEKYEDGQRPAGR